MPQMLDIGNQTFGFLTAIEPVVTRDHGHIVWKCLCACGKNTCPKVITVNSNSLCNGDTTSCRNQQHDQTIHLAIRIYFTATRTSARKRNYVFELTLNQFIALIKLPCKYCNACTDIKRIGDHSTMRWRLRANGIDRWNNALGYIIENCVPCCACCNRAKDTMSGQEYINHCKAVASNNILHGSGDDR
jgi:hypothetical protein